MIKKITHSVIALASLFWMANANATFIFSDVSYTSNSVTFTIDGDMSGYTSPVSSNSIHQFNLIYGGDLWLGDSSFSYENVWSRPVFDNKTFIDPGHSGTFNGENYTWSRYNSSLVDAAVNSATITLTLGEPDLNVNASNPLITFVWGWAGSANDDYTVLGRALAGQVPAPAPLALFGLGLLALGITRKRKS
ncbi:MAG: PEP-CTERM sorting domain-containing protein [Sedimenticola sp.]